MKSGFVKGTIQAVQSLTERFAKNLRERHPTERKLLQIEISTLWLKSRMTYNKMSLVVSARFSFLLAFIKEIKSGDNKWGLD